MAKSYHIRGSRREVAQQVERLCRSVLPVNASEEYVRQHCSMAVFSNGRVVFAVDGKACVEFVPEKVEESPWAM